MTPSNKTSSSTIIARASLLLCAGVAVVAMTVGVGAVESKAVVDSSNSIALDPVVFGSSSGKSGLKSAPASWSSRPNVRWNARFDSNGRFLV
ncbi:MAG: hypothetical protein IPP19_08885 [Verrucomicrobia bacterium]|nr:hypothetical protein [Verrucomicrobiota bacterium]